MSGRATASSAAEKPCCAPATSSSSDGRQPRRAQQQALFCWHAFTPVAVHEQRGRVDVTRAQTRRPWRDTAGLANGRHVVGNAGIGGGDLPPGHVGDRIVRDDDAYAGVAGVAGTGD